MRRCPAFRISKVVDQEITETRRCIHIADHDGSHDDGETRWSFSEGSYSGLTPDHPEYDEPVGI